MKHFVCVLAALAVSCTLLAQKSTNIELNGEWLFHRGDDQKWKKPKLKAKDLAFRTVPSWDWEDGYNGYGWYRKDVTLPVKQAYYFNLGQVDDNCEVYFNGELISLYISPVANKDNADTVGWNQWKKYRHYYIPGNLVKAGQGNTLAIRVWDTDAEGGIRYGNVYIGNTVFYNQLPIQLAGEWFTTDGRNNWLAGFYNDKVAYQNKVWQYGAIIPHGEYTEIELVNGTDKRTLLVKRDTLPDHYLIATDATQWHSYSVHPTYLSGIFVENKNSYSNMSYSQQPAKVAGYIKGYNPQWGNRMSINMHNVIKAVSIEKTIEVHPDGSFEAEVDNSSDYAEIQIPGSYGSVSLYLEQGKTTFLCVDPEEFKIRVTTEHAGRQRMTQYMGELALENKLFSYNNWLNNLTERNQQVWEDFLYTANQYVASDSVKDWHMATIASVIDNNYQRYEDTAALQKAKQWAARAVISSPDNHFFNSLLNQILQHQGEHLEGLQYLVKALYLAEKDNNTRFMLEYKEKIKLYVAEMLK